LNVTKDGKMNWTNFEIFIQGISTGQVANVVEVLTCAHPSPSTVSRVFHSLEEEFEGWKNQKLKTHYLYVLVDGTDFTVIYNENG